MTLPWISIVRLGIVQAAIGGIVVLTTSTLNRVMVVELALPAIVPGLLVATYYAVQLTRPTWGLRSDAGGSRTRWIVGGIAVLALGTNGAALGVLLYPNAPAAALGLSVLAYTVIGLGAGAAGTSLLALLASGTRPDRRAAAAMVTWLMMIVGIALTAATVGSVLEPYSAGRLVRVVAAATGIALIVTILACLGIERRLSLERTRESVSLIDGLREVWAEPAARAFTLFVFLSMTAYFMQELVLEPYAGLVFGLAPGQTTSLSGAQHGGAFVGMVAVGVTASLLGLGSLRFWTATGCVLSAGALVLLAALGAGGAPRQLVAAVVFLGFANGVFAVAAVGSMMRLAGEGRARREGTRMGLWGAAQAIAAGFGGLFGAALADALRRPFGDAGGFGAVFLVEAGLFLVAAAMALRVMTDGRPAAGSVQLQPGE